MKKTIQADPVGRLTIFKKILTEMGFQRKQIVEISIEYGNLVVRSFNEKDLRQRPYVGIVRELDYLNRFTIPQEFRKVLQITNETQFSVTVEQNAIIYHQILNETPKEN